MSLVRGLPGVVTAQTIFDQVLFGLRQQGTFSVDLNGQCRFRGAGGELSCAVGWLISDKDYFEELEEDYRIPELLKALGPKYSRWLAPHASLLTALRGTHDVASSMLRQGTAAFYPTGSETVRALSAWEIAMQRVARDFGLTYTPHEAGEARVGEELTASLDAARGKR